MMERIYIETTFVSYLTARPSRDLIVAGHQQITHDWWDTHTWLARMVTSNPGILQREDRRTPALR